MACGPLSSRRRLLLAAAALGLALPARAEPPGQLEPVRDLQADGKLSRARREPIVVLFSLPGCPYCEIVRRSHLLPMQRDPRLGARMIIREVVIDSDMPAVGFRGEGTTHAAIASAHGVRAVPVVAFWDGTGAKLAEPLSGMLLADFYAAYLEEAIDRSRKRLAGTN